MTPADQEYKSKRFRDLLEAAFGASDLTRSIVEMLIQVRVQTAMAGMTKGSVVFKIANGHCIAVEPHPEFRRGYEIASNKENKI